VAPLLSFLHSHTFLTLWNVVWTKLSKRVTKEKEYSVDFFENKEVPFLEFDINIGNSFNSNIKKIKIHNPLEIMNFKLGIFANPKVGRSTGRKHNEDLTQIFGQAPWQVR
jgi:hypothetical protein